MLVGTAAFGLRRPEGRDPVGIHCGLPVRDRRDLVPIRRAPIGRATEQEGDELGLGARQLGAEHLPDEVVTAIPAPIAIERDHEPIRRHQCLEHRRRAT